MAPSKSVADIVREVFPIVTSRALKQEVDKLWGQWLLEPPMHDVYATAEEDLADFIEEVGTLPCRYSHEDIEFLSSLLIKRNLEMENTSLKVIDYTIEEE